MVKKEHKQDHENLKAGYRTGKKKKADGSGFQFADNRAEAVAQRQLSESAKSYSKKPFSAGHKTNKTGLPDQLKSGIENLSGYSMDDVRVHYNSDKPKLLNAHAYAQGTDIHLGSGQERHLPHEAWHVVQQKQGRVKPTLQLKGNFKINDDKQLEKEADEKGNKSLLIQFSKKENFYHSEMAEDLHINEPVKSNIRKYNNCNNFPGTDPKMPIQLAKWKYHNGEWNKQDNDVNLNPKPFPLNANDGDEFDDRTGEHFKAGDDMNEIFKEFYRELDEEEGKNEISVKSSKRERDIEKESDQISPLETEKKKGKTIKIRIVTDHHLNRHQFHIVGRGNHSTFIGGKAKTRELVGKVEEKILELLEKLSFTANRKKVPYNFDLAEIVGYQSGIMGEINDYPTTTHIAGYYSWVSSGKKLNILTAYPGPPYGPDKYTGPINKG